MLTYDLTQAGNDPLYVYLYRCIRDDIIAGRLSPGEMLPSKRTFAKHLSVSTITVENAYGQLMSEGYIISKPRRGFYVADLSDVQIPVSQRTDVRPVPEKSTPMTALRDSLKHKQYFVDFGSNQTDPSAFPFSIWAKISREILSDDQDKLMTNPPAGGTHALRQAIADHLQAFRGMTVAPEQIIVGAGTEYLYTLLIQLLGFNHIYAVESPGYRKVPQIYAAHGLTVAHIPLDRNGILPDALEKSHADIVHITPSHHFPTGITMPISRRYELLGWAAKSPERYIIEDDYDSEFRMAGKPIPPFFTIDMTGKVIYINTFTKSLASTIRVSYLVLPEALTAKFYRELRFYACTVSTFEQYTLARFMTDGHYEKHINRMRATYRKRRNHLLSAIAESPLATMTSISEENAGLHFLLHVHTNRSDKSIKKAAAEQGLRINALSDYGALPMAENTGDAHTFIINYSSVPDDRIDEAVKRLYTALK